MSASKDGADLKRVNSFQFPAGHVGHLTAGQQDQLQKFKELCKSKGYYTPATGAQPASHDDETLLRYLRARKFIPQEAFTQFKDTEDWRKENQLDTLYETIDLEEYEQTRRLYPQWLGRRDKRGIPLYLFEVSHLDSKAVNAYEKATTSKGQSVQSKVPPKMLRLFALYENLCQFVLPMCSSMPDRPNAETPISQSNNIVDISNVGLRTFWNLKAHMQDASLLATAHYPETLDRIFLIGAPSFFPTVWGWVKRWFDPITVSKIFILSAANTKSTLLEYIDEENIPVKYGGKLDFKFGDMPMLEPGIADNLKWSQDVRQGKWRSFPTGPIKWTRDASGNLVAIAVGSENGKRRNQVIAGLKPSDKAAQATLRPEPTLMRTTTGEATHPPTPPPGAEEPPPAYMTDPESSVGMAPGASSPDTSRAGTYVVPFQDEKTTGTTSPISDGRQGTSHTRYEQQQSTHAADTVAYGTPATQVRDHDAGPDKHAVMEPKTVGQAPKEHPVPQPEEPAPSVIDTAKQYAGQAYEQAAQLPQTVMSAVGYGSKPEQPVEEKPKAEDPAVDKMDPRQLEEFLRAKNKSTPEEIKGLEGKS